MKKLLLIALVSMFAFGFTGCNKEEDPPAPVPVISTPVATTITDNFVTGSGWNGQGTGLEIRNANNDVIFNSWIYSPASAPSYITLNLGETYNYIFKVGSVPQVLYTGTMSISSSGLTYFNSPASALEIHYANNTVTFWKQ